MRDSWNDEVSNIIFFLVYIGIIKLKSTFRHTCSE